MATFEGTFIVNLHVEGMMCQKNCGSTVREALLTIPGSVSAIASFQNSSAFLVVNYHEYIFGKSFTLIDNLSTLQRHIEEDAIDALLAVGFDARLRTSKDNLSLSDGEIQTSSFKESKIATVQEDEEMDMNGKVVLTFQVGGMSCASCTGRVEKLLQKLSFVKDIKVNLATGRVQVEVYNGDSIAEDVKALCIENIKAAGYECAFIDTDGSNAAIMKDFQEKEISSWRRRLIISCALSSPLIVHHLVSMMSMHSMHSMHQVKVTWDEWLGFVLATPVQIIVGDRYYKAAYASLKNHSIGMDFLIVLGSTVSYIYSLILFGMGFFPNLFQDSNRQKAPFETGAMLLTFVTIGKYLEARAKGKTASALQRLMELQDTIAYRCDSIDDLPLNGDEASISLKDGVDIKSLNTNQVQTKELKDFDFVVVKPGGRIPSDGLIISTGNNGKKAYVDESALTGETFPVAKDVGDKVYGATLNQSSFLLIQVTATGSATVLGNILKLVEQAQSNQAPIQSIADRISSIFAPVVMTISIFTLIGWLVSNTAADLQQRIFTAVMSAISVIVVACPCALGLATPTAVMVGTGVGASNGLLIKGGSVLEETHLIDTVIFDKTGTLTTGKPAVVVHKEFISDINEDDTLFHCLPKSIKRSDAALWFAGCVEKISEHPIGRALVDAAISTFGDDFVNLSDDVKMTGVDIVPGNGVEAEFWHKGNVHFKVRIGSTLFASFSEPRCMALAEQTIVEYRQLGYTGVLVGLCIIDTIGDQCAKYPTQILGAFGVYDAPRPEAKSTVLALKRLGIDVWLCTGDHNLTARSLAKEVGIAEDKIRAEVRPEGKSKLVEELQGSVKSSKCCSGNVTYRKVAFVGDGINDSIALSQASVGIALGCGTSVAIDAADIILTGSDLHDVVVALHLSRVVFNRIMYNFLWASAYNVCSIPFAAGLLTSWTIPPALAAIMMPFSSISVVMSSLLLKRYKKPVIDDDGRIYGSGVCSQCSSSSFLLRKEPRFTSLLGHPENINEGDLELV